MKSLTTKSLLLLLIGIIFFRVSFAQQCMANCRGDTRPGGPCYAGPGGPAYSGPGGGAYAGPGGPCYAGPGGSCYPGPGGGAYSGPGGGGGCPSVCR